MKRLQVFGSTPSPYTQKLLSLLRYKHIPYDIHWGDAKGRLKVLDIEPPKPVLLPIVLLEDEEKKLVATTDSTPIIRRLENDYPNRQVIPEDQALSFINYILEDFADEFLTKFMFHYRWHYEADADKAGTILPLIEFSQTLPKEELAELKSFITQRQSERLWVVGSSDSTAELIERSFRQFIKLLNDHLSHSSFILGDKPSSADFGFYGQIVQLVKFDPTPRKICHEIAPRVVAWVEIMDDLSGLDTKSLHWASFEDASKNLKNILKLIGTLYIPLLLENAKAVANESAEWEVAVEGAAWKQKTFRYQAKCLQWIRDEFSVLNDSDKKRVLSVLSGTGCENIL
ncbi:MAG: glutathione S-transferase family protein [Proteobacteria bacterium]|nr:glutathione S-transferase family protein [SAR86 cluster bacterium]MDA0344945.1 glutathione S-transferase family protein [Pseudomonadota bacterium]MDA0900182.1 glutathione S-transferase family protein [Pseudomonadota bacterium]MDA1056541.1 glutathione S-transferase family protein [Pseudomonadota bacterium]